MQTRSYAGPFTDRNADLPGALAWQGFGTGSHIDGDNTTGRRAIDLTGAAAFAHTMVADDLVIPSLSTVRDVTIRYTLGHDALVTQGALAVAPYLRFDGGPPLFGARITPPFTVGFIDVDVVFPLDPDGLPWTRASIYRKKSKLLIFGLQSAPSDLLSAQILWSECRFLVNFTLPVPLVATDPASLVSSTGAQLNGRINPRGATGTYPLTYYFEYGPTTGYGSSTLPIAGITGISDLIVSSSISGLTTGQGFHFRLVVTSPDDTFYGADMYFSTNPSAIGRFRLDEFKRVATGAWDAGDRTRLTSRGFDRPSTSTDDSTCPFLEFP